MSVRVSPVSRLAAILIVVLGLFTLVAGVTTGTLASIVAGVAITVLGMALYGLLFRFTRKIKGELEATGSE